MRLCFGLNLNLGDPLVIANHKGTQRIAKDLEEAAEPSRRQVSHTSSMKDKAQDACHSRSRTREEDHNAMLDLALQMASPFTSIGKMRHPSDSHAPYTQPLALQPLILTMHHTLSHDPWRDSRDLHRGKHTRPCSFAINIAADTCNLHMVLRKLLCCSFLSSKEGGEILASMKLSVDMIFKFRNPVRRSLIPAGCEWREVSGVEGGRAGLGQAFYMGLNCSC